MVWVTFQHEKLSNQNHILSICDETITPVNVVRNLGVLFDSELTMKSHINKTAAVCFYHLRRLKSLRHKIGQELTTRLVLAIIITRLEYCNSLFAGLPQSTLAPLQRVQNAAARLVFNLRRYDHITPALIQLHCTLASSLS